MNKDIITNGVPKEIEPLHNLKIRIPSPKVGDQYIEEKKEKEKERKYNLFTYILYCIYCYPNDNY
jgi:hypothetical protein